MELPSPEQNTCRRCGHVWRSHTQHPPRKCAKCKSVLWNREAISHKTITVESIAQRIERERANEAAVRKHRAQHEALNLFAIVGQGNETTETVRAQIAVSEGDLISLRNLFGPRFAREVERNRLAVLSAFDELSQRPPDGFFERLARKRASLASEYQATKILMARQFAERSELAARKELRGDPWNI
jgi:hypothetical protein